MVHVDFVETTDGIFDRIQCKARISKEQMLPVRVGSYRGAESISAMKHDFQQVTASNFDGVSFSSCGAAVPAVCGISMMIMQVMSAYLRSTTRWLPS